MHQDKNDPQSMRKASERILKTSKAVNLASSYKGSSGPLALPPAVTAYPNEMSRSVPRVSNYNPSMRVFPTNIGFQNDSPLYMPNK